MTFIVEVVTPKAVGYIRTSAFHYCPWAYTSIREDAQPFEDQAEAMKAGTVFLRASLSPGFVDAYIRVKERANFWQLLLDEGFLA